MDEELVYVALIVDEMEDSMESPVFATVVSHYQRFETLYDPPLSYTWAGFQRNFLLSEG